MYLDKGSFNHSASICRDTNTNSELVCWYHGNYECSEDQTLSVSMIRDNKEIDSIEIERKVGNSIIFKHENEIYVIYSRFRKMTQNRIERWQHCILKASKISIKNDKLSFSKPWAISSKIGMLPRCNPIKIDGKTLLPLYYEYDNREGSGVECTIKSTKKRPIVLDEMTIIESEHQMIQPTFYADDGIVKCLGRNFKPIQNNALFSQKENGKWSQAVFDNRFLNFNNSISTFQGGNKTYVLWNNDPRGRRNMTLGEIRKDNVKSLLISTFDHASYPNGIVDENGNLHIVMTVIMLNNGRKKNVILYEKVQL